MPQLHTLLRPSLSLFLSVLDRKTDLSKAFSLEDNGNPQHGKNQYMSETHRHFDGPTAKTVTYVEGYYYDDQEHARESKGKTRIWVKAQR